MFFFVFLEGDPATHRQVLPDGEVLRLDVAEVQLVGKVVVEVAHHVQEAQRDALHLLPGAPPGPRPGDLHPLQREDVLVPGVAGREVLHGVEVSAGAQHLGHMGAEVLQDSAGPRREGHLFLPVVMISEDEP